LSGFKNDTGKKSVNATSIYRVLSGCLGLLLSSTSANASFSSTLRDGYNTLSDNVAQTWNEPEHYDLYIPAVTWHARFAYDKEKTDKYNERPWGAGFGVSRWDDKGNWHGIYLMALKTLLINGSLSAAMAGENLASISRR
jgi:hypothetical protein